MKHILDEMRKVLKAMSGRMEGFYLAGGTALSLYYFKHRDSYDIDFFTRDFSAKRIEKIMSDLSGSIGAEIALIGEQDKSDMAKMRVYSHKVGADTLKMDFIEDIHELIKPPRVVDGIPVLEKEDIYMRKIYAACGSYAVTDDAGKKEFKGGRQEAKDFFDLYFLSTTFMPLSKFAAEYCDLARIESIVVWYRTYKRMDMKLGLSDIHTDKRIDFQEMERHFRHEIERIIEEEL